MKKIFTISIVAIATVLMLASCTKRDYYDEWNDYSNDEWGTVMYVSAVGSPYSIVQMNSDGSYAVIYSMEPLSQSDRWPLKYDKIYGDFSQNLGTRKVYNKTAGYSIKIEVDFFFNSYNDALSYIFDQEEKENYAAALNNKEIKIQSRSGVTAPAIRR